jgi:oligo-1,6-glucosidase
VTAAAPDWWKTAVVYQVYPRSFADSDGDGVGDLGGILDRLDHLQALGIDVIWLSPVYRSPQADNGYDISDYRDIDPLFGNLEQFDQLLAEVHRRGLKLVMDLVVNHTSDEHPWFVESRSSRTNPKRDWYFWLDGREGAEPNNWASFFSGPAWTADPATGQYYLHLFHDKQPDLNWRHPQVRQAVHELMRWWLDRGVDGFRMDVINFISKADGLPDAPPVTGHRLASPFSMIADGPPVHDYLAELTREVFGGRSGEYLTVGEMPGVTTQQAVLYTDPARAELNMVFQFEHVDLDHDPQDKFGYLGLDLVALKRSLHRWQAALADRGWNSLYWNNHDQPRVVSRFGDDDPAHREASAKALGTILHGMRGTPFVYQGEELGMTNYPFRSIEDHQDVEAVGYYRASVLAGRDPAELLGGLAAVGRDNARTPMQWDAGPQAGFSTGTPWLPVNPNHDTINAAEQRERPDSVFAHYQALIRLRHQEPILAEGDFSPLAEQDPVLWAYVRRTADQRMLVLANCGRQQKQVELEPEWSGARLLLGNLPGTPASLPGGPLTLAGWEAAIYLAD